MAATTVQGHYFLAHESWPSCACQLKLPVTAAPGSSAGGLFLGTARQPRTSDRDCFDSRSHFSNDRCSAQRYFRHRSESVSPRRWHVCETRNLRFGNVFRRQNNTTDQFCSQFHSDFPGYGSKFLSPNRRHMCGSRSSKLKFPTTGHFGSRGGVVHAIGSSRAEAAENVRVSGSTGTWGRGIPLNSQPESCGDSPNERWTQSISVEPAVIQPPSELTSLQQDCGMTSLVLVGAFIWVRLFDFFTSKHILGQKLSRKIVHITSGLIYLLCWPFFSSSKWAPFIAGVVPLANGIRLVVYGLGILKDEGLVKSMSRSGESRELLRGPLFYVVVLYLSTVLFWRNSPGGIIALTLMCGGDGIADIMGRKFGSKKLPYNSDKSFAGSIAMFLFGFVLSVVCVYYFTTFRFFELDWYSSAIRLAFICLVATVIESLPITSQLDDNFTVPAVAFLLGMLLFPS